MLGQFDDDGIRMFGNIGFENKDVLFLQKIPRDGVDEDLLSARKLPLILFHRIDDISKGSLLHIVKTSVVLRVTKHIHRRKRLRDICPHQRLVSVDPCGLHFNDRLETIDDLIVIQDRTDHSGIAQFLFSKVTLFEELSGIGFIGILLTDRHIDQALEFFGVLRTSALDAVEQFDLIRRIRV